MSTEYTECFNTLPVPIADAESPVRCRYVYGYGVEGLVPRPPLQKPPSRGLKGLGARGGGDEGLKVEGGFTFGRLQGGLKGASRGLEGGFKGASRGLHLEGGLQGGLKGASRGLEGGLKPSALKGASRMLEGGLKGASRGLEGGFKGASP